MFKNRDNLTTFADHACRLGGSRKAPTPVLQLVIRPISLSA
ncbi:hypothetical protein [Ammoniphilus sp. 3BR4]